MNAIFSALESGYSPQRILKYIQKIDPDLAVKINSALQVGHSIEQVLGFISKNGNKLSKVFQTPQKSANPYTHARKSVHPALKNAGIFAGAALAGGAGAYALSRALPAALPRAAQALQGELLPAIPKPPPKPMQIGMQGQRPQLPAPGQAAMQPPPPQPQGPPAHFNPSAQNRPLRPAEQAAPQAPIAPQRTQPVAPTPIPQPAPIAKAAAPLPQILQKQVEQMLKAGNDIETIGGALEAIQPKIVKEHEKITGQPIARAVEEFASQSAQQPAALISREMEAIPQETIPEVSAPVDAGVSGIVEEKPEIQAEETKPLPKKEKGATVALPSGEIGEIINIRQGIATVEADGKKFTRKLDELDEEPEDVIQIVQDLLKIPEIDKSSIVSLFTFDPEEKKMYIQFHNGESYKYLDVDPEKVFKIANKMGIPVTEGQNIFGAWSSQDKKSLGATLIKEIINDPKYKKSKKGEPNNPNYVKLETLYDYWEKLRKKNKRKGL